MIEVNDPQGTHELPLARGRANEPLLDRGGSHEVSGWWPGHIELIGVPGGRVASRAGDPSTMDPVTRSGRRIRTFALLSHPDQLQWLRDNPDKIKPGAGVDVRLSVVAKRHPLGVVVNWPSLWPDR